MTDPSTTSEPELVLVTGATGYIAGHCIEDLLRHGYAVRGTVRNLATAKIDHLTRLDGSVEFVEARLDDDRGWADAVAGCTYVLHVASPFPPSVPKDEDEVIRPAVEGTLRVLRAAAESTTVRRVVQTSSTAAVSEGHPKDLDRPFTEADWSVVENLEPYAKSKTLAERAAWEFVDSLPEERRLELAVINPGLVLGPLQRPEVATSLEVVHRLITRSVPAVPQLGFAPVDVRDLATAHRLAMESPKAPGHRYICAGDHFWMRDMARILAAEFDPRGYRVPTRHLPYAAMWVAARFDPTLRLALGFVGRREWVSAQQAADDLGWTMRPTAETLVDTASSLIDHGLARPTR